MHRPKLSQPVVRGVREWSTRQGVAARCRFGASASNVGGAACILSPRFAPAFPTATTLVPQGAGIGQTLWRSKGSDVRYLCSSRCRGGCGARPTLRASRPVARGTCAATVLPTDAGARGLRYARRFPGKGDSMRTLLKWMKWLSILLIACFILWIIANQFDEEGYIFPIKITKNNLSMIVFTIDYQANY